MDTRNRKPKFAWLPAICLILALVSMSCANAPTASPDVMRKIEIDLTQLDENGLRGPADGKVAVSYEFAIPNTDKCKAEVKAIDDKIQFMPGSRGRIGAGKNQCLCIGTTSSNYREVLPRLAERPYITRIIECYFE